MTPKEGELLQALRRLTVDGVSPTYEHLCSELGLASKSGVHRLIKSLERQGRVRTDPCKARSLEVVERTRITPEAAADAVLALVRANRAKGAKLRLSELREAIARSAVRV